MKKILWIFIVVLAQACSDNLPTDPVRIDEGQVSVSLDKNISNSSISFVILTLTHSNYPSITREFNIKDLEINDIEIPNIPVGNWNAIVSIYNYDEMKIFEGNLAIEVSKSGITPIEISSNPLSGNIYVDSGRIKELLNSLVAFYPFLGDAEDYSGNEVHGIVHGAELSEDRFGKSNNTYYFDGNNNFISLPIDFDYPARTICLWFNFQSFTSDQGTIFTSDHPNLIYSSSKILIRNINNFAQLEYQVGGGANDRASIAVEKDTWYFLAMSITPNEVKCFLNGEVIAVLPYINHHSNGANFYNSLIGTDRFGNDRFFHGSIDDIIILDKALTEEEVALLYQFSN